MIRSPAALAVLLLSPFVLSTCELPPAGLGICSPCATADVCCAARTANPDSNCKHLETCLMFTGESQAHVADGCAYYLRVGSTPPAPAACGPHPADDFQ